MTISLITILNKTQKSGKGSNYSKKKSANGTRCSQAVTHPSTNRAQHCLTSVIGRELVCSMWYGRCQRLRVKITVQVHPDWIENSPIFVQFATIVNGIEQICCAIVRIWTIFPRFLLYKTLLLDDYPRFFY